jgi:hypothetical protein
VVRQVALLRRGFVGDSEILVGVSELESCLYLHLCTGIKRKVPAQYLMFDQYVSLCSVVSINEV